MARQARSEATVSDGSKREKVTLLVVLGVALVVAVAGSTFHGGQPTEVPDEVAQAAAPDETAVRAGDSGGSGRGAPSPANTHPLEAAPEAEAARGDGRQAPPDPSMPNKFEQAKFSSPMDPQPLRDVPRAHGRAVDMGLPLQPSTQSPEAAQRLQAESAATDVIELQAGPAAPIE